MPRIADKPQLDELAGTEIILASSVDGGTDTGAGTVPPGADVHIPVDQLIARALDNDPSLAGDSATKAATQQAVKAFVEASIAALGPSSASIGVQFLADTASTSDADPGAGNLRWNHATQTLATVLYLDDATVDGASLTAIWPRLNAGGVLFLQHATDQDIWQIWEFTAINDAAGYAKLTVTLWGAAGTFADNAPILVTLDKGQSSGAVTGVTAGKHAIWIPAGAMSPSASGGCAALATIASAANQPDIQTLDFDASTAEYAQFSLRKPKSWNEGTVTFVPAWSHAGTTTNFGVVWTLQAVAVSDDDTIAANYGTAQSSTDTGGTTNDVYQGPESSAITIAGSPAAQDVVFYRVGRLPTDGSDTMAIDARLHGITVYFTTDADNDA